MICFNAYCISINFAVVKHGFGCVVKFRNSYNACCAAANTCCACAYAKAGNTLCRIGINFKALCFNVTLINACCYLTADSIGIAGKPHACTNTANRSTANKTGHVAVIACVNEYVTCIINIINIGISNACTGCAVNHIYINSTCNACAFTCYTGSNQERF